MSGPTAAPSKSPSPSQALTDCAPIYEMTPCFEKGIFNFIEKIEAEKELPEDVIKIVDHSGDSVLATYWNRVFRIFA
jgi:hypothetical protein